MHPFVIGELACGDIRNRREVLHLLSKLPAAPVATEGEALAMIERHKLMGRGLGYVDVHLLTSVALCGCRIWSRDKQLAAAAADLKVGSMAKGNIAKTSARRRVHSPRSYEYSYTRTVSPSMKKTPRKTTIRSSGNVFIDVGFPPHEAAIMLLRCELAEALRKWIEREGITQAQAAERLGVAQPQISEIWRNKVGKLSLDYLVGLCAKAGLAVRVKTAA